ncbi:L-threonylcarbamoyladenylate synthase [Peptostreptococcus sp. D1]|uniref:L-threonylcarbamoyladenylate synthase n=1 Tax=Peptostreptococcus sp. D1 TaxID=72304 RepID=UPI0008E6D39A|nr:L-threonylcarbamoyladenylate synthase [Peptostreptococcus sp. D1]SFE23271.1 L-threonylcarbamoyladenylate synthase [Peptostreptococcus sp. D1]
MEFMKKNTVVERIDPDNIDSKVIERFGKMLADGKTVIFPTETVYGLGANALDEQAASKIYVAKGRPSDNPLLVHVAEREDINPLVVDMDERAKKLIDRFWPGPLTIVFKKSDLIPKVTSGGLDTVAIRMPSDKVARALIKASGVPIAAPSANLSGKPSPTKPEHIIADMNGRVDGILVGGFCDFGVESTIVDLSENVPMVLRPGAITLEMLKEALGAVRLDPSLSSHSDNIKAKAPGMKYKHYSPNANIFMVTGGIDRLVELSEFLLEMKDNAEKKIAILCMKQNVARFDELKLKFRNVNVFSLGSTYEEVARNLFDVLIALDKRNIDVAYAEAFEEKGIGVAIMNRLKKSAGYKFV